jgi:hypothetical protein
LIITNSALSGARRADVTDFDMPEHHGQRANLNLNKWVIREMSV